MSLYSTLALILCSAIASASASLLFQNFYVGGFTFVAVIASSIIARIFSGKKEELKPSSDPARAGANTLQPKPGEGVANSASVPLGALLEATMNSMREGVLVLDSETRVVAANRAASDLFSSAEGVLVSKRLSELTRNPSIHSAFLAALGRDERAEVKVETHGTERRIFDLRVAPLSQEAHAGEVPRGVIGVFFDITRLERLERVRQEFLSNVSHELRTPLTAILTFVETLEDGAIDDQDNNRRFLSVIRRNASRMQNLIDDILELSAIEAGTVRVEIGLVHLHSLVSEVLLALAPRAATRSIEMRNEISVETTVHADARRLEQMITNLVDNAIKFNREGGAVVIKYERGARDQISVTDTGEGIGPEHTERIFERFYRVDRGRSRALGGTGLGLAIVKHLARAHGGETQVRSTPGQGATFVIELPVIDN